MSLYTITNGITYLKRERNGSYCLVKEPNASKWKTYEQAVNALNKGISEWQRDVFFIVENGLIGDIDIQGIINADTSNFESWCSDVHTFKKFVKSINAIKSEALQEMRNVEAEICDILHYIEFNKLNAAQGWEAYEILKNSRIQRRKIKNLLYIIGEIQKSDSKDSACDAVRKALKTLKKREYKPRKLDFLFEKK